MSIGPVPSVSVSAWAVAAQRTVEALREQPELGVPDDVIGDFERYVTEWRGLAASSPSEFLWTGDVVVAEVRRLASYWALLANIARTDEHPTGVEPAPEDARPFYDALVAAMAEVLAVDDADKFSDKFEEVAPSFDEEIPTPGTSSPDEKLVRVLLVDDTEDIRLLFRIALQSRAGFEVCGEATNGQEALDAVAAGCPDAIVLDVMMPRMDGLTALPLLVERCPAARIVIVTSAPTPKVRDEALAKGAVAVVDKQVSLEELRSVLAAV